MKNKLSRRNLLNTGTAAGAVILEICVLTGLYNLSVNKSNQYIGGYHTYEHISAPKPYFEIDPEIFDKLPFDIKTEEAINSRERHYKPNFLIGDSMAYFSSWNDVLIHAMPGRGIQEIQDGMEISLNKGEFQRRLNKIYVFLGTADAGFPPNENYKSVMQMIEEVPLLEIGKIVNTDKKLNQFVSDFQDFIDFLEENVHYQRMVIISPFPNTAVDNLIERVDGVFARKYGNDYFDINDHFYDFGRKVQRDASLFRGVVHLSDLGYIELRKVLEKMEAERIEK